MKQVSSITLLAMFIISLFVLSCDPQVSLEKNVTAVQDLDSAVYDAFQYDVLDKIDDHLINSSSIGFKSVQLGDSLEDVIQDFGKPDKLDSFPEYGVVNLVYYANGTNITKLTFNILNDSIERIVVKPGMESFLINRSKINYSQADITRAFGKPDKEYDVRSGSSFIRVYHYYPEGLEIYHKRKQMIGWAIVDSASAPQDVNISVFTNLRIGNEDSSDSNYSDEGPVDPDDFNLLLNSSIRPIKE